MRKCAKSIVALVVTAGLAVPAPASAEEHAADDGSEMVVLAGNESQLAAVAPRGVVRESGTATWYGLGFEGRKTASGERFSSQALTAAHKTLPFGTRVRVTALDTLSSVVVTINDRLPNASRHVVDLSRAAGRMLGMIAAGVARVRIEIID